MCQYMVFGFVQILHQTVFFFGGLLPKLLLDMKLSLDLRDLEGGGTEVSLFTGAQFRQVVSVA
jgi:hypothetical protein